jgi:hypothetical protein
MHYRKPLVFASLSAVLALSAASPAGGQDTTRTQDSTRARTRTSQQRITLRKSGGEVALPRGLTAKERADSIARADSMARADSLAAIEKARQDSVAAVEKTRQDSIAAVEKARTDSVAAIEKARADSLARIERARADSIAQAAQVRQPSQPRYLFGSSGFYLGVAGGGAIPTGDFKNLGYDNGWGVNVPIGWRKPGNMLGLQLDLGYNQFNGTTFVGGGGTPSTLNNSDPKILSANLNATLNFPLTASRRTNFYLIGGGGVYRFQDFGVSSALGGFLGNDVIDPDAADNQSSRTKWGLNGGAGLEFGIGPTSLFVESRFVNVFAKRDNNADFDDFFGSRTKDVRWVPIVLGVTFR